MAGAKNKKQTDGAKDAYSALTAAIAAGSIGNLYIFHGEERYLLDRALAMLRKHLCPDGLGGFNYKRFEGRTLTIEVLADAINTMPVFAERTLVEVHDFDIFKSEHEKHVLKLLSDLPGYVCVSFVYTAVEFTKKAAIAKIAEILDFATQDQARLVKWVKKHYNDMGKQISTSDAEYLSYITGGYMTTLHGEIEKTAAYAKGETVTRADIDAVVIPELDAVAYKLTDALARRDNGTATRILDELFRMREPPHKIMFSISLNVRKLLAARVCIENKLSAAELVDMCGLRFDWQARPLLDAARKMTLAGCRDAAAACAATAFELNNASEPEAQIVELVAKLALAPMRA